MSNWYLFDARTMVARNSLYSETDAKKLATDLNYMILRNTMPLFADMGAIPTGPYFARKSQR